MPPLKNEKRGSPMFNLTYRVTGTSCSRPCTGTRGTAKPTAIVTFQVPQT